MEEEDSQEISWAGRLPGKEAGQEKEPGTGAGQGRGEEHWLGMAWDEGRAGHWLQQERRACYGGPGTRKDGCPRCRAPGSCAQRCAA